MTVKYVECEIFASYIYTNRYKLIDIFKRGYGKMEQQSHIRTLHTNFDICGCTTLMQNSNE